MGTKKVDPIPPAFPCWLGFNATLPEPISSFWITLLFRKREKKVTVPLVFSPFKQSYVQPYLWGNRTEYSRSIVIMPHNGG